MVFEIPSKNEVYVLAGINGCGKSTLLTCLARIKYWGAFRDNFKASRNDSIDLYSGTIKYEINGHRVTYSKKAQRWRPSSRVDRTFDQFQYKETLLCDSTGDRLFVQNEEINSSKVKSAEKWLIEGMNEIFSTSRFKNLKQIKINGSARGHKAAHRTNIAYLIDKGGQYYSEKNFSLGEILILNLLLKINAIQNESMLLIDEIELALYPKVQINLLNYLSKISQTKHLTVIISTHSASLIKNAKHIILLEPDVNTVTVSCGCSPAKALGEIAFQEDINQDAIFFVEDKMAKYYLRELLQLGLPLLGKAPDYRIIFVGGFDSVVKLHAQVRHSVLSDKTKAISFLDEDVKTDSIPHYSRFEPACDFIQTYNSIKQDVQFLPSTPEVGLVDFIETNTASVKSLFSSSGAYGIDFPSLFGSVDYTSQRVIVNTKTEENSIINAKPKPLSQEDSRTVINNNGSIRKAAKKKLELILNYLNSITNEEEENLTRCLFKEYVNHCHCTTTEKNNLKSMIGPLFS